MMEFDPNKLFFWEEGGKEEIEPTLDFGLWCLSHNIDAAATLAALASIAWDKGWNARDAIFTLCQPLSLTEQNDGQSPVSLPVGENTGDSGSSNPYGTCGVPD